MPSNYYVYRGQHVSAEVRVDGAPLDRPVMLRQGSESHHLTVRQARELAGELLSAVTLVAPPSDPATPDAPDPDPELERLQRAQRRVRVLACELEALTREEHKP